jgi:carbon monoxide dehydrogenase subunit G
MATLRHHTRVDAPADEVWKLVADTGNIAAWFPGLDASSQEGDVRTVNMGGMEIKERIVTNDDDLRRLQYTIIEPQMGDVLVTLDVIDEGEGCLVVYAADFSPDELRDLLDPTYAGATQAIKQHAES